MFANAAWVVARRTSRADNRGWRAEAEAPARPIAYGPTRRKNVLDGSVSCGIDQNGVNVLPADERPS